LSPGISGEAIMKNRTADIYFAQNSLLSFTEEEACQLILNTIEDPFLLIDRNLRVVATNLLTKEKTEKNLGVELTEGMNVLDLAPPEQHAALTTLYQEVFSGEERKFETELLVNGQSIYFSHHLKPARDKQGMVVGAVVSSRDITAQKKSEKALAETEERWRFALEGSKQGVWDWNMQTGEVFYSISYKRLYGFEHHELFNRIEDWQKMVHPDDREKIEKALQIHIGSTDPYYETNYRIQTRNGDYIWVMARGMIIGRDEDGKPRRMIGTHTDITEQVNTELRIKISERQYKTLFQSNPLPTWIYDTNTLQFLEVNDAAIAHYGFTKEEFLNSNLYTIHPDHLNDKLNQRLIREKEKTAFALNNWQHRKKNGDLIFVDLRINAIDYKGITASLVVAHDVTAKVLVENELRISNERFSYAAKASSEALWEWDVIADEFYISQAYTDILGWKLNDNRKFDEWHDYIHPDDSRETITGFYASIDDPQATYWSREYRYLKADGTYAIVIDKAVILRNDQGAAIKVIGAMQDVTAQKKTEEELRISNNRYKHVILATSDMIWDLDLKSNMIVWSDNFTKVLGWELSPENALTLEACIDHFHPYDTERVQKSMSMIINDPAKTKWREEFRYRKSDGSYAYVSDRGYLIRNEKNEPIRMVGAMQDITEWKLNEQLLSLERLIFEMSTDLEIPFPSIIETLLLGIERMHQDLNTMVIVLRQDDSLETLAAPSLSRSFIHGVNNFRMATGEEHIEEVLKHTIIIEDLDKDPKWSKYRTSNTSEYKACWSLPIIHSSGNLMGAFVLFNKRAKAPSPIELNSLQRVRHILRILMEHNWSLNEIKVAHERFDIMMKATHDLIWDWNLEKNIIYRDEAGLKKVYGMDSNASIVHIQDWLARIHPDDQDKAEKMISQILQTKQQDTFDLEYRFRKDDGTYSNVFDRGMIIRNEEGKPIRMIGAAQDVTERKRLEQELLQNELERQKAINQATVDTQEQERSEIGKELHDNVNQVLTTTKLYLDLAMTNVELKDELIQKSTRNIISVINEIRQLSRSLMDPSIGDLGLIDSINDLIENINLTRKLHVRLTADKKIETLLTKTHKLTVFRIIQEALNNAIRHARATTVQIQITTRRGKVEIGIEDDGIGFNPLMVKKGAGLKNIQNRIYLINGTQNIYSAPDKGCKIIINFPIIK
jgi:PAS domain S-box-containing protein